MWVGGDAVEHRLVRLGDACRVVTIGRATRHVGDRVT
jgi:hypothetical protein